MNKQIKTESTIYIWLLPMNPSTLRFSTHRMEAKEHHSLVAPRVTGPGLQGRPALPTWGLRRGRSVGWHQSRVWEPADAVNPVRTDAWLSIKVKEYAFNMCLSVMCECVCVCVCVWGVFSTDLLAACAAWGKLVLVAGHTVVLVLVRDEGLGADGLLTAVADEAALVPRGAAVLQLPRACGNTAAKTHLHSHL